MKNKDYHTTKAGVKIALIDMHDDHLNNTIAMIERMAKKGIIVGVGGGGPDIDDFWYSEDKYSGKKALYYLEYDKYIKERKRREKLAF